MPYRAHFNEHGVSFIPSKRHTGFYKDVWPGLPSAVVRGISCLKVFPKLDMLIGRQNDNYGLRFSKKSIDNFPVVRGAAPGTPHRLVPFDGCQPNTAEKIEHAISEARVSSVDNNNIAPFIGRRFLTPRNSFTSFHILRRLQGFLDTVPDVPVQLRSTARVYERMGLAHRIGDIRWRRN
jgi:hypothetical protein